MRMTIERLDTFRLANEDICHETKKGKIILDFVEIRPTILFGLDTKAPKCSNSSEHVFRK